MKLNCIVIEDDVIQRMINVKLVNKHHDLHLIGDFHNAADAKNFINSNVVDLIFLDIELSDSNGFEFLDSLKVKPQVIFITSHAKHALKAYEYRATDFIQKPITLNRFNTAVKRAVNFHGLNQQLESEYISIKSNLRNIKVYLNKIKWIEAFGDYVKVITEKDKSLVLSSMRFFEEELPQKKFLRVHKSFIINVDKVNRFNSKFVEIGITKIPLSRNKKENLINALAIA